MTTIRKRSVTLPGAPQIGSVFVNCTIAILYGIAKARPLLGVPGAKPPGGFQGRALSALRYSRGNLGSTSSPNSRIDACASASAMSLKLTCTEAISKSPICRR